MINGDVRPFYIDDNSSKNNTYLNGIWTRYSEKQVGALSEITGIEQKNIITEEARYYNRITNPDTGTGITLNQDSNHSMGLPEFYTVNGSRANIKNGHIYRVEGTNRMLVGIIDETGEIILNGGK